MLLSLLHRNKEREEVVGRVCGFPSAVSVDSSCARQSCNQAPIRHSQEEVTGNSRCAHILEMPRVFVSESWAPC